ncbi:MAG: type II secretion system F family protein [Chloroflexi bacterium]|jgi:tight adherence protein B|nr:type II secretion system F family protein [Chloroflexota bacterium]
MALLLAGLLGVAVVLAFLGLERLLRNDDPAFESRLRRYALREAVLLDQPATGRSSGVITRQVGKVIAGRSFAQNLQAELGRANLKLTAAEFLILQATSTLLFMAFGYALISLLFGPNVLALPIFGLLGFALPKVWLVRREAARLRAFNDQLADTIILMSNSLRAGMSLLQAMDMVAREGTPPISDEFQRVVREVGLGLSPQDALLHLVHRIRSEDLDLMVTAMLVQHEVGGNLARILDTIAHTIRERVKLKGEINTLTSQGRMSGWILAALPVVVAGVLLLASPQYMRPLFDMPYLILPVLAAISVVIGHLVIQRIVNIEI